MVQSAAEIARRGRDRYLVASAFLLSATIYADLKEASSSSRVSVGFIPTLSAPTAIFLLLFALFAPSSVGTTRERWDDDASASAAGGGGDLVRVLYLQRGG